MQNADRLRVWESEFQFDVTFSSHHDAISSLLLNAHAVYARRQAAASVSYVLKQIPYEQRQSK